MPEQSLARASAALLHRGPDDGGIEIVRVPGVEVGLANRRLAIIDLSPAGHQPMFDADTGNWITYNGELYNFRALRAELEARGLTFRSHSDTEVILKAYGVWGEKCLDRFRGMFALAIWDAARRRLFVGRDPMGIKPLYYFQDGSRLVFASEVRALLATGLVPRRLAAAGLATYLMFGSVYDPFTLIEGVRALPAGHWLTWQDGRIETQEYWDVPHDAAAEGRVESASALPGLLDQTVELHTVSDVPIGVFLSGGIDSSALVALLSRRARVSTFSVVFREAEYNEAPFSRAVAERFHTDHHELTLSQQDALEAIPDALRAMDLPSMDGINTYIVSRQAVRAGLKVAMSGLGGDELFAGYDTFRRVPAMERFVRRSQRLPRPLRAPVAAAVGVLGGNTVRAQKLSALIAGEGGAVHPYFLSRMLFLPVQQAKLARGGTAQAAATTEQFMAENLSRAPASDASRVPYTRGGAALDPQLLRQLRPQLRLHRGPRVPASR